MIVSCFPFPFLRNSNLRSLISQFQPSWTDTHAFARDSFCKCLPSKTSVEQSRGAELSLPTCCRVFLPMRLQHATNYNLILLKLFPWISFSYELLSATLPSPSPCWCGGAADWLHCTNENATRIRFNSNSANYLLHLFERASWRNEHPASCDGNQQSWQSSGEKYHIKLKHGSNFTRQSRWTRLLSAELNCIQKFWNRVDRKSAFRYFFKDLFF